MTATITFILLFKGALGAGGGFGALILAIILIYWLYRKESGDDMGCAGILMLPLMPIIGLVALFGDLDKKGIEKELDCTGSQFDLPPSLLLKVLVALSAIAVWIMAMVLMADYDVSEWLIWLWAVMMPLMSINLYVLWLRVFFVRLGRMRPRTAVAVCFVSVLLIILFWIFAVKAFNHYTSLDYLSQYWQRKYGVI